MSYNAMDKPASSPPYVDVRSLHGLTDKLIADASIWRQLSPHLGLGSRITIKAFAFKQLLSKQWCSIGYFINNTTAGIATEANSI